MAEIWFYSASGPVEEEELDERPFDECVSLLELTADRYLGEDPTQALTKQTRLTEGDRYLVVAVSEQEASAMGWRPGYYPSPLEPVQALKRLGLDPSDVLDM